MKTNIFSSHAIKHTKALIATLLSLTMILSIVACNSKDAATESTSEDIEESEATTTDTSESESIIETSATSHAQMTPADMPGIFVATGKINTSFGNTYMSDSIDGSLVLFDCETNTTTNP